MSVRTVCQGESFFLVLKRGRLKSSDSTLEKIKKIAAQLEIAPSKYESTRKEQLAHRCVIEILERSSEVAHSKNFWNYVHQFAFLMNFCNVQDFLPIQLSQIGECYGFLSAHFSSYRCETPSCPNADYLSDYYQTLAIGKAKEIKDPVRAVRILSAMAMRLTEQRKDLPIDLEESMHLLLECVQIAERIEDQREKQQEVRFLSRNLLEVHCELENQFLFPAEVEALQLLTSEYPSFEGWESSWNIVQNIRMPASMEEV